MQKTAGSKITTDGEGSIANDRDSLGSQHRLVAIGLGVLSTEDGNRSATFPWRLGFEKLDDLTIPGITVSGSMNHHFASQIGPGRLMGSPGFHPALYDPLIGCIGE